MSGPKICKNDPKIACGAPGLCNCPYQSTATSHKEIGVDTETKIAYTFPREDFDKWYMEMYGHSPNEHVINLSQIVQSYISRHERMRIMELEEKLARITGERVMPDGEIIKLTDTIQMDCLFL